MEKSREEIVVEILEKLLLDNMVHPEIADRPSIEEAVESIFGIFGKTAEIENED